MAKHRSAAELAEIAQARANALLAKALRSELKDHPEVVAIDREIATLIAANLKYDRWSRDAEDKIANFLARAKEWQDRGEIATAECEKAKEAISALRTQRNEVIAKLAAKQLEA